MAGDWIKMRTDLAEDPAVIAIAAKLDVDEFAVVGRLHHLWGWFDSQSRDGHAPGVTRGWIDRKTQLPGFAAALETVGWLQVDDRGATVPKFDRHNGKTAKARALSTIRKQASRANGHESVPENVTPLSRNQRDKSVTREEKRREEEKNKNTPDGDVLADVDPQIAADFRKLRGQQKAPITATAVAGIRREAEKAGLTLSQALEVCCARGWRGFKAEWLAPRAATPHGGSAPEPERRRQLL
jgi:hypothetical protein